MTDLVERFSAESLLRHDIPARVMRPRLQRVDVHWHDYYELCLVLAGEAEHILNGEARTIRAGGAFLLSPADFHSIHSRDDALTCYNVVIGSELIERQLEALGGPVLDGLPWLVDDFADAEPDFARLQGELDEPRPGSTQMVEALVACLVVGLARRCGIGEHARPAATAESGLRDALVYLDRHFREPITLADAAATAHLSPNYFSERFRSHTGSSFQMYLQDRRLRFARSLLASTSLSVTEVCHAAGFNNLSHFGRAFRRRYGAPPSVRLPPS